MDHEQGPGDLLNAVGLAGGPQTGWAQRPLDNGRLLQSRDTGEQGPAPNFRGRGAAQRTWSEQLLLRPQPTAAQNIQRTMRVPFRGVDYGRQGMDAF